MPLIQDLGFHHTPRPTPHQVAETVEGDKINSILNKTTFIKVSCCATVALKLTAIIQHDTRDLIIESVGETQE